MNFLEIKYEILMEISSGPVFRAAMTGTAERFTVLWAIGLFKLTLVEAHRFLKCCSGDFYADIFCYS